MVIRIWFCPKCDTINNDKEKKCWRCNEKQPDINENDKM